VLFSWGQTQAAFMKEQEATAEQKRLTDEQKELTRLKTNALIDKAAELERADVSMYMLRVTLADREWLGNRLAEAAALLELCPPERRAWEWHFQKRRLTDNRQVLRPKAAARALAFSP